MIVLLLSADDKCQKVIGRPKILPKISGRASLACLFVDSLYNWQIEAIMIYSSSII